MIIIIHEVYARFTLIAKKIYKMLLFDEIRFSIIKVYVYFSEYYHTFNKHKNL